VASVKFSSQSHRPGPARNTPSPDHTRVLHSVVRPFIHSALQDDLWGTELLDEALVVVAGEFGRTPQFNHYSGRDLWARYDTRLLVGGGVQGGAVYGASDATGAFVLDKPVTPDDFHATVLHAFGVTPETAVYDRTGRPVRVTTGEPVTALF
jgi:hypothetical protein